MILKIRNKNPDKGTGWRIIDNIKAVNYEYMTLEEIDKKKEKWKDLNYGQANYEYLNFETETHSWMSTDKLCLLTVDKKDGSWFSITTDDTIYILNDDGKTVDGVYQ